MTTAIVCEECGCQVFEEGLMLRKVAGTLVGTQADGIVPVPVFRCTKCGHVNQEFIPQELK